MDTKQALERLKELEVDADVIEALEGSSLRKRITELETQWTEIGEPAVDFKAKQDTLPKRKEAFQKAGVKYDDLQPYGQEVLDGYPADKLDDADAVAEFIKSKGFEATIESEDESGEKSGAEEITDFLTSQGSGEAKRTGKNAKQEEMHKALESAKTEEEAAKILAAHGQLDTE